MDENARNVTIEQADFTVRTYNCLHRAEIKTLGEIADKTQGELLKIRNLGKKNLEEILNKLNEYDVCGLANAGEIDVDETGNGETKAKCEECDQDLTVWREENDGGFTVYMKCEHCRKVWKITCDKEGVATAFETFVARD